MTPYFTDPWLTVFQGDALAVLRTLPSESVHCAITSPPFYGLRDYGTGTWEGGEAGCDHRKPKPEGTPAAVAREGYGIGFRTGVAYTDSGEMQPFRDICRKCGARRIDQQIGLEATPEQWVAALVAVFHEVKRVLRNDGTLWLEVGDSYAAGGSGGYSDKSTLSGFTNPATKGRVMNGSATQRSAPPGLKPKDLIGAPWMLAFALRADGWYLRSDIIWARPNPMPESVTDRPTKSHSYLFLLSKSARYFYDADAVREANVTQGDRREGNGRFAYDGKYDGQREDGTQQAFVTINPAGRNLRSVWSIATEPYPGAHFATFPRKLVEPCIKAGTSERGVCPACGAPWVREVERGELVATDDRNRKTFTQPKYRDGGDGKAAGLDGSTFQSGFRRETTTTGWRPTCDHDGAAVPAVVLDCFAGTGTVGLVAQALSRRAVLIDLSMDYLDQLLHRNRQTPLGLI